MSKSYPQVLLFGDSILQQSSFLRDGYSFGAVLAEHCIRRFDVVNRGLSGYNTAQAVLVLEDIVPSPNHAKVAYMLILFGSNDACLPGSPTKQHVPLEDYKKYIKTIITHPVVKAHDPIILLVAPPPVNESQLEVNNDGTTSRVQDVTAKYADAIRKIVVESQNEKVVLLDLHSALMKEAAKMTTHSEQSNSFHKGGNDAAFRTLLTDGLHLTGAGYKVFAEEVLPKIEIPPFVLPVWTEAPRIDEA